MALQTSSGYVRITNVSLGSDNTTLTVNWLTFHNSNWRENNPRRVWQNILENGSHTFDLAIKEIQSVELETPKQDDEGNIVTHEDQEVIIGYKPQSIEQAHIELMNLDAKEAKFSAINWQIV